MTGCVNTMSSPNEPLTVGVPNSTGSAASAVPASGTSPSDEDGDERRQRDPRATA